jgi:pyruvate dehydrogenase E2 component (dihydrolipoamide acetyltransferase)
MEGREKIRISPVARKLAEEHVINVATIVGTGPDGRIVREDMEKAISLKASTPPRRRLKRRHLARKRSSIRSPSRE